MEEKKIEYTGRQNNPDGAPSRKLSYVVCFLVALLTVVVAVGMWMKQGLTWRFYLMAAAIDLVTLGFMFYTRYFSGEASDYEAFGVTTCWHFLEEKIRIVETFGPEARLKSYCIEDVVVSDKDTRKVCYQFEKKWIRRIIWDTEIHACILAWNDSPENAADAYALFFVNEEAEKELFGELAKICPVEQDSNGGFLK